MPQRHLFQKLLIWHILQSGRVLLSSIWIVADWLSFSWFVADWLIANLYFKHCEWIGPCKCDVIGTNVDPTTVATVATTALPGSITVETLIILGWVMGKVLSSGSNIYYIIPVLLLSRSNKSIVFTMQCDNPTWQCNNPTWQCDYSISSAITPRDGSE